MAIGRRAGGWAVVRVREGGGCRGRSGCMHPGVRQPCKATSENIYAVSTYDIRSAESLRQDDPCSGIRLICARDPLQHAHARCSRARSSAHDRAMMMRIADPCLSPEAQRSTIEKLRKQNDGETAIAHSRGAERVTRGCRSSCGAIEISAPARVSPPVTRPRRPGRRFHFAGGSKCDGHTP